jgi:hypothetical protein
VHVGLPALDPFITNHVPGGAWARGPQYVETNPSLPLWRWHYLKQLKKSVQVMTVFETPCLEKLKPIFPRLLRNE